MIHGKHPKRKDTDCGKALSRRWWVLSKPYTEKSNWGYKTVDQRKEITCPECRKQLPKEFRLKPSIKSPQNHKAEVALRRAALKFAGHKLVDGDDHDKRGQRLNQELLRAARLYAAVAEGRS